MSRIPWSRVPSLRMPIQVPDLPETEEVGIREWMQHAKVAMETLAAGNVELERFLDDVLLVIKDLDRDGLAALAPVTETATVAYGVNEQTMLTNLKTAVNGILTNI